MRRIKELIKNIPYFGPLLVSIYIVLKPKPVSYWTSKVPSYWIDKYLKNKTINVVQIGSNDGVSGDPVFDIINKNKKWSAVFVEPVPYLFEKLKKNYNNDRRFVFENVAINEGVEQPFYYLKEEAVNEVEELHWWYDQVGSFSRNHIFEVLKLDDVLEPYIEEKRLKGLPLYQLLERNKLRSIGLLHVDTEGCDWIILRQLDLKKLKPQIILFEFRHLIESDRSAAIEFFKNDYYIFQFEWDYLCINKSKMRKRDFRRLYPRVIID